jgi:hypothetical protein
MHVEARKIRTVEPKDLKWDASTSPTSALSSGLMLVDASKLHKV